MFRAHWKILFLLFQLAWLHVPSRLALSTLHQPLLLLSHGLRINSAHTPTCAKGPTVLELHPWEARRRCQRNSSKFDCYNMFELHRVLANTKASWNSRQTQGMLNGSCITNVSFQISCGSNLNVLSESCCLINHRLISQISEVWKPKRKLQEQLQVSGQGLARGIFCDGPIRPYAQTQRPSICRSGASFRAAWLQNGIAIHAATAGCQMYSGKEIWIDVHTLRWGKNYQHKLSIQILFSSLQSSISTTSLWARIVQLSGPARDTEVPGLNTMCICCFLWIYF